MKCLKYVFKILLDALIGQRSLTTGCCIHKKSWRLTCLSGAHRQIWHKSTDEAENASQNWDDSSDRDPELPFGAKEARQLYYVRRLQSYWSQNQSSDQNILRVHMTTSSNLREVYKQSKITSTWTDKKCLAYTKWFICLLDIPN